MNTEIGLWDRAKACLEIGTHVSCIVKEHHPFGVLVVLEQVSVNGVIERIRMGADGFNTPDEYPPIGSRINAIILGFRDYSQQVELSLPRLASQSIDAVLREERLEVGLRVEDGALSFFGLDEVNDRIAEGHRVVRIEKGRAIMVKSGESADSVKMRLEGFSVLVAVANSRPLE